MIEATREGYRATCDSCGWRRDYRYVERKRAAAGLRSHRCRRIDSQLEAAARRFARAFVVMHEAAGPEFTPAALELDEATHEVVVLAGEDCPYCDPGTCEGALPERELAMLVRPIADTPPL